jgi:hypothetical protein
MHHHKSSYYLGKEKSLDANANIFRKSKSSHGDNSKLYVKNSNKFEKSNNKSERNKNIYKNKDKLFTCLDKQIWSPVPKIRDMVTSVK